MLTNRAVFASCGGFVVDEVPDGRQESATVEAARSLFMGIGPIVCRVVMIEIYNPIGEKYSEVVGYIRTTPSRTTPLRLRQNRWIRDNDCEIRITVLATLKRD